MGRDNTDNPESRYPLAICIKIATFAEQIAEALPDSTDSK